ncbi:hypothetical protein QBC38DRAFT_448917 [Podospora fimiseda]|uniref:Rhodopsin domain-containing protein n=1 Tax=Podospora fimiseda TaxID=252190 RepID=A0AAN7BF41_9PEZI|nr:hypothetical protein QBC38DRAFT_448917 [Podospora fimiseda]
MSSDSPRGGDPFTLQEFLLGLLIPVILPTIFVAIRLLNNHGVGKGLEKDDWWSIIGLGFVYLLAGIYYGFRSAIMATDKDMVTKFTEVGRWATATAFIGSYSQYFAKIPILLLYLRLFGGVYKWLRITCYMLFLIPVFVLAGSASYCTAYCVPERKTIDGKFAHNCMESIAIICVFNGAFALVSDIIIFILPLPAIAQLTLAPKKKLGLFIIFLSGLLGVIACAVAVYYRAIALSRFGQENANNIAEFLGPIVECSVALVVSSIPAMSSFWRRQIAQSPFVSKVQSLFSSRSTNSQRTPIPKKSTQGSSGFTASVDPYNSDPYNIDPYTAEINGYHELRKQGPGPDVDSSVDLHAPKKVYVQTTVEIQRS